MENPVVGLGRVLGATRVTQRIARDLYDRTRPDLAVVYFGGTDEVGHLFASFTPPRLACASVTDSDVAKYGRVVHAYYAAMDRILGQWMRRAEEDGAVLLVQSDHGFKWGSDRPCGLASGDWSTAAFWHRPEGVLAIWGRDVRRGQPRGSARLVDVAPTVLALLEVPGEPRMTGRPVAAAFSAPLRFLRTGTATPEVRRVADAPMTEAESSEYAKKLLALGYLSPGETSALAPSGGDEPGLTEGAWNNLGAWELKTRKNLPAAEAAFRESLRLNPEYYSPMFNLAVLSRERGDTRSAEDWLFRSLSKVRSDPSIAIVSWAREYAKARRPAAAESLLARAAAAFPDNEAIARERARFLHENKDCRGAADALARFESGTTNPGTLNDLALYETCLQNREAVERLLTRSLALDPNQPAVRARARCGSEGGGATAAPSYLALVLRQDLQLDRRQSRRPSAPDRPGRSGAPVPRSRAADPSPSPTRERCAGSRARPAALRSRRRPRIRHAPSRARPRRPTASRPPSSGHRARLFRGLRATADRGRR